MFKLLLGLLLASSAVAFTFHPASARASSMALQAEKSKALPFLGRPQKLDGTIPGDFGFDPLRLSENVNNLDYVTASELKHGRVAMLAVVGFIFQQYVHIFNAEADPLKAVGAVGYAVNLQLLVGMGIIELATWEKTFHGQTAGDLGFDPLNQLKGKSPAQVRDLKVKEVKNGRLAMVAIIGLIVQNLVLDGQPSLSF